MFLFVLIILMSSHAWAQPISYGSTNYDTPAVSVSVAGFSDTLSHRGGGEIAVRLQLNNYIAFGLAGVLYDNDDLSDNSRVFGGYSASLFFSPDWLIQPYAGAGIFSGNRDVCERYVDYDVYYNDYYSYEECEERYIFAAYPEMGVRLHILSTEISLFTRRYFDSSDDYRYIDMIGLSIGYGFN